MIDIKPTTLEGLEVYIRRITNYDKAYKDSVQKVIKDYIRLLDLQKQEELEHLKTEVAKYNKLKSLLR